MLARVNFFESSVEHIKKEFPRYLQHQVDLERSHSAMAKLLKDVASTEPNNVLQYVMFLYAQKEDMLAKEHAGYRERMAEVKELTDSWSKLLIRPIRDVLADHQQQAKKLSSSAAADPAAAAADPAAAMPPSSPAAPSAVLQHTQGVQFLLPVHMKLFEKHRLAGMKRLLHGLLAGEVAYHAKALEAYAQLLECVCDAEDRDNRLPV